MNKIKGHFELKSNNSMSYTLGGIQIRPDINQEHNYEELKMGLDEYKYSKHWAVMNLNEDHNYSF